MQSIQHWLIVNCDAWSVNIYLRWCIQVANGFRTSTPELWSIRKTTITPGLPRSMAHQIQSRSRPMIVTTITQRTWTAPNRWAVDGRTPRTATPHTIWIGDYDKHFEDKTLGGDAHFTEAHVLVQRLITVEEIVKDYAWRWSRGVHEMKRTKLSQFKIFMNTNELNSSFLGIIWIHRTINRYYSCPVWMKLNKKSKYISLKNAEIETCFESLNWCSTPAVKSRIFFWNEIV